MTPLGRAAALFLALLPTLPLQAAPVAGGVVNAASSILPGLPNGNLTPGGMFSLFGSEMGPAQLVEVDAFPLPTQLAGTSIAVTVGGVTVDCILVYSSARQAAGILPSSTPLGAGSMTVSYEGQTSAPLAVTVAAGNFGIFSLNQQGSGPGVFSDPLANPLRVNGHFESARPGEAWDIWGTGLGPISGDEAAGPAPGDLTHLDVRVLVAGQEAQVLYRGRSGCCAGVDQIRFLVPEGVSGCSASVVVVVDGVPSNFVTMALNPAGGTCSDPGRSSAQNLQLFRAQGYLSQGQVLLGRVWTTTQTADGSATTERSDSATASFVEFNYNDLLNLPPEFAPAGSCLVTPMQAMVPATRGLEAGRVSVAGPPGMFDMTRNGPGFYAHAFEPPAGPLPAGAYSFAGPGGEHIGPFEAAGSLPDPIELLNPEDLLSIDRGAGLQLRWTGGSAAGTSFVQISGTSPFAISPDGPVGVRFDCWADAAAGEFDLPAEVLRSLPASVDDAGAPAGSITFGQTVYQGEFNAQGADVGQFVFSDLFTANTRFR